MLSRRFLGSCFVWIACSAILGAAPILKVEPAADGKNAKIQVFPSKTDVPCLLDLVDAKTGVCIATLHAGTATSGQTFSLGKIPFLKPGGYTVRFREGISITPDLDVKLQKKEKWINPRDIVINSKGVYVYDSGFATIQPEKKEDGTVPEPIPGKGSNYVYRFTRDGQPDAKFADRGRATLWEEPRAVNSFDVDDEGIIYVTTLGHEATAFDSSGNAMNMTFGGWDNDPNGPKGTGWVNCVAVGHQHRLYIYTGYSNMKVYDRTKNAFEGIMYMYAGMGSYKNGGRPITADRKGAIYHITPDDRVQRFDDTGTEIKPSYESGSEAKMCTPMGLNASAGLIWVVDHGPSVGPFWDTGGDTGVMLFWDSGAGIHFVDRYGAPGKAADKLEFIHPSAVAQSPEHTEIWVVEDGMPCKLEDSPPGNARVRRFKITATQTDELPLELK